MLENDKKPEIEIKSSSSTGSVVGALLILVSIATYVFFLRGVAMQVSAVQTDISAKTDEVTAIQKEIDDFKMAEETYGVTTSVQKNLSLNAVPIGLNQDEVIEDLISVTESYDTELNSLSFGTSVDEDVSVLRVNASFEGNYSDLVSFLQGLERNARVFSVKSISVQISDIDILDLQKATFSLAMEAYYQNNNE